MWDWVCFAACAVRTRLFFLCNFGLQIALSVSKTGFCNCFFCLYRCFLCFWRRSSCIPILCFVFMLRCWLCLCQVCRMAEFLLLPSSDSSSSLVPSVPARVDSIFLGTEYMFLPSNLMVRIWIEFPCMSFAQMLYIHGCWGCSTRSAICIYILYITLFLGFEIEIGIWNGKIFW